MTDSGALLPALERLFAGPRESTITLNALLAGLEDRSYAFIIAALALPNCIPTGIPLLSTVTGLPMLLFVLQRLTGPTAPSMPAVLGNRSLPRGKLQDFLRRAGPRIAWLENLIHPRHEIWLIGLPRRALQIAWIAMIVLLALPIPFDNLFAAWSILFFCLALIEGDGVMAMLGWLFAAVTTVWTALLLIVGPMFVIGLVKSLI
jgi:hypothetical protein